MIPAMCLLQADAASPSAVRRLKDEIDDVFLKEFHELPTIDFVEIASGNGFTANGRSKAIIFSFQINMHLFRGDRSRILKGIFNVIASNTGTSEDDIFVAVRSPL